MSNKRLDWMDRINCRDINPKLFFPAQHDWKAVATAKEVCAGCEVTSECLEYALANHLNDGIIGNTTGRERRKIKKDRAREQAREVG